jgi:hypothetical protein
MGERYSESNLRPTQFCLMLSNQIVYNAGKPIKVLTSGQRKASSMNEKLK